MYSTLAVCPDWICGPDPGAIVATFTPPASAVYAGGLTVKALLALLFAYEPPGMNTALTWCFPR